MSVKVLICGNVQSNFEILINRLNTLQNSAHGPFQVLFIVGELFVNAADYETFVQSNLEFPLPTYVLKSTAFPDGDLPKNVCSFGSSAGVATISQLTVAFATDAADEACITSATQNSSSTSYRGCDILLSSCWPRDVHQFLSSTDYNALKALGGIGSGSKAVANFAARALPRYHFATDGAHSIFYQRPPYSNNSLHGQLATRFISLAAVSDSKDKDKKWLHALSLEPIVYLGAEVINEVPTGSTDCPYILVGKTKLGQAGTAQGHPETDAPSKRFKGDPPSFPPPPSSSSRFGHIGTDNVSAGSFFFGGAGGSRGGYGNTSSYEQQQRQLPPNEHSKVLFIGGINSDISDAEILKTFPNSVSVRRPGEGKGFAFVEFRSHAAAVAVMDASYSKDVVMRGKHLKFGWSKEKDGNGQHGRSDDHATKPLLLEPPSPDATKLFIGGLPFVVSQEDVLGLFPGAINVHHIPGRPYLFLNFYDHDSAAACVVSAQSQPVHYQGSSLTVGWADTIHHQNKFVDLTPPYPDCRTVFIGGLPGSAQVLSQASLKSVLAKHLQIHEGDITSLHRADGKEFAFVEFSNSTTAKALIEQFKLTVPVDGSDQVYELVFGWAKGKSADHSTHNDDCWFCLGSPSVKTHLIVSISDHSYVALPKGGIVDYHLMISPIDCVPNRLMLSKGQFFCAGNSN
jgi:RNA recognition motif-containing protein